MLFTVNSITVLFTSIFTVNNMASELGLCNLQCHYPGGRLNDTRLYIIEVDMISIKEVVGNQSLLMLMFCFVLFCFVVEAKWGGPLPECSCTPCLPGGPPRSHHPTHTQRHSKGNDMRTIPVYLVTRLYTNCTCVKVQSSALSYLLYVCCLHFKYWHLNKWQTMLGCLE